MLKSLLEHPLSGCSLTSFAGILRRYYRPSGANIPMVLKILLALVVLLPFRLAETVRYGRKVAATTMPADPIFIIGHWRSGTTLLEDLLSSDASFGFCRYFGNQFPFLSISIQRQGTLLNRVFSGIRIKRPQDNVVLGIDTPSEEEFAIAKVSTASFLLAWIFRAHWDVLLGKYLTMEAASERETAEWERAYLAVARKWTCINRHKRLVMKSPYNTARLRHVLRIFPNAKFIHIARDPAEAIVSTIDMLNKMAPFALTPLDRDALQEKVIETYKAVALQYGQQRCLVPERNLVEIRFEDLMRDPAALIVRIYAELDLSMSEDTQIRIQDRIRQHSGYRRNTYAVDHDLARRCADAIAVGNATYGYGPSPA